MTTPSNTKSYSLATLTKGLDVTVQGDPNCQITGIATIQNAKEGDITFLMNSLYKKYLLQTKASAIIVLSSDAKECATNAVISADPYYTYAMIAKYFDKKPIPKAGISPSAVIGESCNIDASAAIGGNVTIGNNVTIGKDAVIGPNCSIGDNVVIGEACRLDANVSVYYDCKLGKRVKISSGTVIGSEGFGIAKHKGVWHKVPQIGAVIIEDDVDIGANTAIDRGAIEDTVIKRGVQLDNLIQIGHNVTIGEHTAVAGCVGIAGSAKIGSNCLIGGGAGINGHISITDNVVVTGMSAISKSINEPGMYSTGIGGVLPNLEWRKSCARFHRLEQLFERVKHIESAFSQLSENQT